MNKEQYTAALSANLHEASQQLQEQFPALAARPELVRSVLQRLIDEVASNTRAYELLGIHTADELALEWKVTTRRAQAFISTLNKRFGVGRRAGKMWLLSAEEAAIYRPGAPGQRLTRYEVKP